MSALAANSDFRAVAVAVLDAALVTLSWTWLITCPEVQVSRGNCTLAAKHWVVPAGVAGNFTPFRSKPVYDARLLNVDEDNTLLLTFTCKSCMQRLSYAHLHLTANITSDGGCKMLRAWVTRHVQAMGPGGSLRNTGYRWAIGRNQAFFLNEERRELLVQPWLGLVASFGRFDRWDARILCTGRPGRNFAEHDNLIGLVGAPCAEAQRRVWSSWEMQEKQRRLRQNLHRVEPFASVTAWQSQQPSRWRRVGTEICGPSPRGSRLHLRTLATGTELKLLLNETGAAPMRRLLDMGPWQLSPSVHLLHVRWTSSASSARAGCSAYLGVAHWHRGYGRRESRRGRRRRSRGPLPHSSYKWGFDYRFFFYTLHPRPPYHMLATSGEFCFPVRSAAQCEPIQYISGMTQEVKQGVGDSSDLLLTFGINDCDAGAARISSQQVQEMLRPLNNASEICAPISP